MPVTESKCFGIGSSSKQGLLMSLYNIYICIAQVLIHMHEDKIHVHRLTHGAGFLLPNKW